MLAFDDVSLQGWLVGLGLASLATTASKVAFMGWGIGLPEIDFTGISGHTMLAMAVYPLLFATLASQLSPQYQRVPVGAGFVLALMVTQLSLKLSGATLPHTRENIKKLQLSPLQL